MQIMSYYQFNSELIPAEQQAVARKLLDCNNFHDSDRLLGASHGRGTTWFLATMAEFGVNSVRRHYYRGGLFGKLVNDRFCFRSLAHTRAAKEFALLQQMRAWGLPVPRPLAFKVERRWGTYRADILLEKIEQTEDLSKLLQREPLQHTAYRELGVLIRRLHDKQVHHSDLNIHNILRTPSGQFWLIDFDKCGVKEGESWKQENLARLMRSFHKERERLAIRFNEDDWQALMVGYAAGG